MAIDAFVPCNCLERGIAKPPPPGVIFDSQTGMWTLEDGNANYQVLNQWLSHACEHKNLNVIDIRLGNASAMSFLREAAHELGLDNLIKVLPTANGGSVPYELAEEIFPELEYLKEYPVEETVLESLDGYQFYAISGTSDTFLGGSMELSFGLGGEGLYIWSGEEEIFRSKNFLQRALPDISGRAEYIDIPSGKVTQEGYIIVQEGGFIPERLQVNTYNRPSEMNKFYAETLRQLLEAAVAMKKPVYWY